MKTVKKVLREAGNGRPAYVLYTDGSRGYKRVDTSARVGSRARFQTPTTGSRECNECFAPAFSHHASFCDKLM